MKLYDFHCNACGRDFEDLVSHVDDAKCPACKSADVAKQLSGFAVGGRGGDALPPGGGGCAGGFCGGGACGIG